MNANQIQASKDLERIRALRKSEDFTDYYLRRQDEKIKAAREIVLHGKFSSPQELWDARQRLHGMEEIAKFLDEDETGARNILPTGEDL